MHALIRDAIGIATLITLGYWLLAVARPFKTCRKCHGYGRLQRRIGPPKECRKCKGTGLRGRASRKAARAARRTWGQARR
jgi:ribosomal protein L40E